MWTFARSLSDTTFRNIRPDSGVQGIEVDNTSVRCRIAKEGRDPRVARDRRPVNNRSASHPAREIMMSRSPAPLVAPELV